MKRALPVFLGLCFISLMLYSPITNAGLYYSLCLPGGTNCQYFFSGSTWYECSTSSNNTQTFFATHPQNFSCMLGGTYQWYKFVYNPYYCEVGDPDCCHGWCAEPISGATSNAYTVTEAGSYFCLYDCGGGITTTDTVEVIYHSDVPSYTSPPANASVCEGTTAPFSCSYYNASYALWQELAPGGSWTTISGENTNTLDVLAESQLDGYQYRCAPNNACGTNWTIPGQTGPFLRPAWM